MTNTTTKPTHFFKNIFTKAPAPIGQNYGECRETLNQYNIHCYT
ncbi:hypothetical protein MNB_SUP05-SYMBIONT-5-1201 [hydrothermal vent metagenome]|uniref:Uncharacterized protein n=1 Tax=hydrothermal vent metagenome TaxID=652676 RepID=A0A1W1E5Y0_9ZZZZ